MVGKRGRVGVRMEIAILNNYRNVSPKIWQSGQIFECLNRAISSRDVMPRRQPTAKIAEDIFSFHEHHCMGIFSCMGKGPGFAPSISVKPSVYIDGKVVSV